MRIRSIKPEFWRSEDIAELSWEARLVFVGLWSYVDDNGVGKDNERAITADLFALEEDPRDTLARVQRALAQLAEASLISRYTVAGRGYLHISSWDRHQKIDRPGKPRYPAPTSDDAVFRDTLATPSRDPIEGSSPGAVDQGTGEQGIPPTAADAAAPREQTLIDLTAAPRTAQTLVAEWIDHCQQRPPSRVIGQVSKELGLMLTEGISFHDVRTGLQAWHERGLHPSALASVVHEQRTSAQRIRSGGRMSPGQRLLQAAALGEQLQAEDDAAQAAQHAIGAST